MIPARAPTRERVREFECPRCGAQPTQLCAHQHPGRNHQERVEVAQRWLGRQLALLPEAGL
jgi:hypothetical protein